MGEREEVTAELLDREQSAVEFLGERMELVSSKEAEPGELTPVHLYLGGALGCAVICVDRALRQEGIDAEITAEGRNEKEEGVELVITIKVKPKGDVDPEKVREIAEKGLNQSALSSGPAIVEKKVVVED